MYFLPRFQSPGSLFCALLVCFLFCATVQAQTPLAPVPESSETGVGGTVTTPQVTAPPSPVPTTPTVHSHYAVLIDADTGKILWGRNENSEREIASTTKIMTAILLLERGHLDDLVTAPAAVKGSPESSLHLSPGETVPLHDLLYAMLLRSANDTAIAGATYLCGSVPAFVEQMNLKAAELGCAHTHFVTPNGLYAPGHYSTAADLATMARYATLNLPEFNEIVKTQKYKITRSMHVHDEWVKNTSFTFLKTFPGADGIKTGYIHQAGHCFVGSATRKDADGKPWRLIAVALDSNDCREDVMSLLNYGFANTTRTLAVPQGTPLGTINVSTAAGPVPVQASGDVEAVVSRWHPVPRFTAALLPLPTLPAAPIAAGTKLGTFTVLVDGRVQASGDAVASQSVALKPSLAVMKTTKSIGRTAFKIVCGVFGVAMLFFMGVMMYARAAHKKAFGQRYLTRRLDAATGRRRAPAKTARKRRNRLAPGVRSVD